MSEQALTPLAENISNFMLFLLIATFIYALIIRFVTSTTLYDRTLLLSSDPNRITHYIEPAPPGAESLLFPSIFEPSELCLSVIIPVHNSAGILNSVLDEAVTFLSLRQKSTSDFTWELIVVDDFSRDSTADIVLAYARNVPQVRLLRQSLELGRGASVQSGCIHARGRLILVWDANGEVKLSEFVELERKLLELIEREPSAIVIGSNSHLTNTNSNLDCLISLSGVKNVRDVRSGLRLFSREAVRGIFPSQHLGRETAAFEVIAIALRKGMAVAEVPVEWSKGENEQKGLWEGFVFAVDLLQIALFYRLRLWTIKSGAEIKRLETGL
jgi:dolichyl-phosphate beta-glucosyltransferase